MTTPIRRPQPTQPRPMMTRPPSRQSQPAPSAESAAPQPRKLPQTASRKEAHRESVLISDTDLVAALTEVVGTTALCEVLQKDKSTLSRWRNGQRIPADASQVLRSIYEIFALLASDTSVESVRNWFITANPDLDSVAPITLLKKRQFQEIYRAAEAFQS